MTLTPISHPQSYARVGAEFTELWSALASQYSVERELGRGGMGAVFLARDVRLELTARDERSSGDAHGPDLAVADQRPNSRDPDRQSRGGILDAVQERDSRRARRPCR